PALRRAADAPITLACHHQTLTSFAGLNKASSSALAPASCSLACILVRAAGVRPNSLSNRLTCSVQEATTAHRGDGRTMPDGVVYKSPASLNSFWGSTSRE